MVNRVKVMSEDEIKRHEKRRAAEDEYCRKIYMCCCLALCTLGTVYLIVMLIFVYLYEREGNPEPNDLLLDNGSLIQ
jgi:hypothetical protein